MLALKWDELGLLRLVDGPSQDGFFARVFNCYKDVANDRQIGDRRQVNKHECHLGGPSSRLPNGQLLVNLSCEKWKENLRGRAAALPAISTTLAARLSGSCVSVLLYRRCLASLVDGFFSLATLQEKEEAMRIVPLERRIAEELVSLAIMAPICVSDLSSAFLSKVFATDASMSKEPSSRRRRLRRFQSLCGWDPTKGILCYAGLCCS